MKPLKWYQSLSSTKGRRQERCFLIEGHRAVSQTIASHADAVREVLCLDEHRGAYAQFPTRTITRQQLREITAMSTPQGVAAVVTLPEDVYTPRLPSSPGDLIVFLDDVQDPGNIGTVIRTAAAFGFSGILLSEGCADPFAVKSVQSSAGTVLSVWIRRTASFRDLLAFLKEQGYELTGLDAGGQRVLSIMKKCAQRVICLGNEAHGITAETAALLTETYRIPINRDHAESLNVSVSAAIGMYSAVQQRIDLKNNF